MNLEYCVGDILKADAEALVNSVNCVGAMGRGIALQFKKAWPENFKAYAAACRRGEVRPGKLLVFETGKLTNPRYIINFPTKRHWRGKSRIEDIEAGLQSLVQEIRRLDLHSVALPPLGCGLGGLSWPDVRSRIERALATLTDVRILVYEPTEVQLLPKSMRRGQVSTLTPGRAVLVGLMERYINGLLVPFVSLLELHKLMYFLQEAGEPLRLRFTKGVYGPYAENLRHVLKEIEGHYISGYGSGGDQPDKKLELVPGAVEEAYSYLASQPETRERFERVSDLVEGFESPYGLELLATAHWIITRDHPSTAEELVEGFHAWAERKRRFSKKQILLATQVLVEKGWVRAFPTQQFATS
ncbi:macro domain-containing protein [Synechococcus sp. H55.7]|uniref:type II toxin-antitoxin system antitoxin DNA ADP-ribosyl glycohydrolase DarG n=1 Tax=unclassified Synechococcus TaxID=2626047 RepID=UPI0039C234EE